ncbi:MAG: hypothetical protein HW374_389 [Bacteroidetes bacterium]|nr:hypothetical protein [Bacteroidota bacterium]
MKPLSTLDIPYFFRLLGSRPTLKTLLLIAVLGSSALAQNGSTATQVVTIEVKPITKISVTGNPNPMIIFDAVSGQGLTSVEDQNTKYNVTTNLDNMKIVASIDTKMPDGTKLLINLASSKASSAGLVDLTKATTPVDVVTGFSRGTDQNQTIQYVFAGNADLGEIPSQSRTVTLTLTD